MANAARRGPSGQGSAVKVRLVKTGPVEASNVSDGVASRGGHGGPGFGVSRHGEARRALAGRGRAASDWRGGSGEACLAKPSARRAQTCPGPAWRGGQGKPRLELGTARPVAAGRGHAGPRASGEAGRDQTCLGAARRGMARRSRQGLSSRPVAVSGAVCQGRLGAARPGAAWRAWPPLGGPGLAWPAMSGRGRSRLGRSWAWPRRSRHRWAGRGLSRPAGAMHVQSRRGGPG
jgi:hypothetical protein